MRTVAEAMGAGEVVGDDEAVAIGVTARKAVVKIETTLLRPIVITLDRPETTIQVC
jgi:hypothetical protein